MFLTPVITLSKDRRHLALITQKHNESVYCRHAWQNNHILFAVAHSYLQRTIPHVAFLGGLASNYEQQLLEQPGGKRGTA